MLFDESADISSAEEEKQLYIHVFVAWFSNNTKSLPTYE